jgi:glycosyltransferase involved in cell wall biosynthesis
LLNQLGKNNNYIYDVISVKEFSTNRKQLGWNVDNEGINIKFTILKEHTFYLFGRKFYISPKIFFHLLSTKYNTVIVGGYYTITSWLVIMWAKALGIKVIVRFATHKECEYSKSILSKIAKTILLKFIDSFIAYGSAAKQYLMSFGIPDDNIVIEYNTVDVDSLLIESMNSDCLNVNTREEAKEKLSLSGKVILYVGQLIERKNIKTIIKSLSKIQSQINNVSLVIVGEGSQKKELQNFSSELNLKNIRFVGGLPASQVNEYYKAADLFILVSTLEPWGLVVNEAMCFGCPIIVSRNCGCSHDLLKGNGWILDDPYDYSKLSFLISSILHNKKQFLEFSINSYRIIKGFNIKKAANAIENSIKRTQSCIN